jgi:2,4'-dihydroxyacetophenone dioxygenase
VYERGIEVVELAEFTPPAAFHRSESELPFVVLQKGVTVQVLHADIERDFYVVRLRGEPGATLLRHEHTGHVFAFTHSGAWRYLEYPDINTAGSYLYEPVGSAHTLQFLPTNAEVTDVSFVVHGANLSFDARGNLVARLDAQAALTFYRRACFAAGLPEPDVIGANA